MYYAVKPVCGPSYLAAKRATNLVLLDQASLMISSRATYHVPLGRNACVKKWQFVRFCEIPFIKYINQ